MLRLIWSHRAVKYVVGGRFGVRSRIRCESGCNCRSTVDNSTQFSQLFVRRSPQFYAAHTQNLLNQRGSYDVAAARAVNQASPSKQSKDETAATVPVSHPKALLPGKRRKCQQSIQATTLVTLESNLLQLWLARLGAIRERALATTVLPDLLLPDLPDGSIRGLGGGAWRTMCSCQAL